MTPRVLMVTPGFRGRPGGVEVHCSELVAGLARYDVDIEEITATRDIRRRVQKSPDPPVSPSPPLRMGSSKTT